MLPNLLLQKKHHPPNSKNIFMQKSVFQTPIQEKQVSSWCLPDTAIRDPAGIGLRSPYYDAFIQDTPPVGWIEVHPENYFGGGAHRHFLKTIREKYPLSLHAVGLSLGSAHSVEVSHLQQIKELINLFDPFAVSDHASWSASGNAHLNDLLPLPYTQETLRQLCDNIGRTQDFLKRPILVENPSTYISFKHNDMTEYEFMNEAVEKTGCGLLLDINNIYVQSRNHGLDPYTYIDNIRPEYVGEMHLAGHSEKETPSGTILVDTHNTAIRPEVWDLYRHAVKRFGCIPTLIEWDQDFPPLDILLAEAQSARNILLQENRISNAAE